MKIGGDKLNFLDVILIRNYDTIELDWYHKPTFPGRYLNFLFHHSISQKEGQFWDWWIGVFYFHTRNIIVRIGIF